MLSWMQNIGHLIQPGKLYMGPISLVIASITIDRSCYEAGAGRINFHSGESNRVYGVLHLATLMRKNINPFLW